MIPQEKGEAVRKALTEAFGVAEFEDISQITRGHTSSLVFRIVVGGTPYLLKIITRAEDQTRHYVNMRTAAKAGVAPRVLYANVEDKISITGFVQSQPLSVAEARVRVPVLLRTLHAAPRFDQAPFNTTCTYLLGADGYLERFRAANLLSPAEYEEFFARLAELRAVYPRDDGALVSCHNDLFKPDNFVFDGGRVWLVDWEAAFPNDRYADLAVVANLLYSTDDEERAFLGEYFGAPPDEYQRARLHLMQQLAHLFYTMAFLTIGGAGQPIDWSGSVPEFTDFHQRWWAGELDLADRDVKVVYGKLHWRRFLLNARQTRYNEALRLVSTSPGRASSQA